MGRLFYQFLGYFVNGEPQGNGTYTWPNGDKFEGEFRKPSANTYKNIR